MSEEAKRIKELEEEIQNTKNYYNKRIREIEEKHKYGKTLSSKPPAKSGKQEVSEDKKLQEQVD